ncbi:leukocyte cysteine proteinase inhibitor 1 [Alligator sinensis]|uniref:Leukocyte cysteine proteinase inhibitor 1 n=1 Tax=Alligator sinensis TaxID=38654 RepID=A0A1U7S8I1_ALLSI|nr:leukocyte cysteine proteinase inhibitor 1 [Alligator sinensis]
METAGYGGLTPTEPATPEVQKIADQVKSQLEAKTDKTYTVFKAIIYRTQLVAGTNYFIKVQVGENDYVHLRVFLSLPNEKKEPRLDGFQTNKTRDDPLIYF